MRASAISLVLTLQPDRRRRPAASTRRNTLLVISLSIPIPLPRLEMQLKPTMHSSQATCREIHLCIPASHCNTVGEQPVFAARRISDETQAVFHTRDHYKLMYATGTFVTNSFDVPSLVSANRGVAPTWNTTEQIRNTHRAVTDRASCALDRRRVVRHPRRRHAGQRRNPSAIAR